MEASIFGQTNSVSLKWLTFPKLAPTVSMIHLCLLCFWKMKPSPLQYIVRENLQEMTNVNSQKTQKMMRTFTINDHARQRWSCRDWLVVAIFEWLSHRGSETNRKLIEAVHSGRMTQITACVSSSSLQTCNPELRPTLPRHSGLK